MGTECCPLKEPGWFNRLSSFFRHRFGQPVYKIPLDGGFTCPNRDGTISLKGCSFCHNPSFSPPEPVGKAISIGEQISRGKKKKPGSLYLAYFQTYTNTYAPPEKLKRLYEEALADPAVIGLSIATRPDCISPQVLDLLECYALSRHIWIEYGLQSAHDSTLEQINRGHKASAFTEAVEKTRNRGIFVCAHIILGLPGETEEMMLETIAFLNRCAVNGLKFHHLQVIKNTYLAQDYLRGCVSVYEQLEDYIPILCDCLEKLSPEIVIHRLAAQASTRNLLVAPHWREGSGEIAQAVEKELKRRGTCQGSFYRST